MKNAFHLLLVEDNPADIDLVRELLPRAPGQLDIAVVMDGVEAVGYLRGESTHPGSRRPDLVLLDLNLPKRDGRYVLREIAADKSLCEIPVIVLTSSAADSDVAASYQLGANCYITKPVDLPGFRAVMNEIAGFWFGTVRLPSSSTV